MHLPLFFFFCLFNKSCKINFSPHLPISQEICPSICSPLLPESDFIIIKTHINAVSLIHSKLSVSAVQAVLTGFPDGPVVKNPPARAGATSLIHGLGRPPGKGDGSPLQYSCLQNSMDKGAWWATVHGVTKSRM